MTVLLELMVQGSSVEGVALLFCKDIAARTSGDWVFQVMAKLEARAEGVILSSEGVTLWGGAITYNFLRMSQNKVKSLHSSIAPFNRQPWLSKC